MSERSTIDLAEYLFVRLQQLGLNTIHGVPGDYNLSALDYIEPLGIRWAGNSNELNASYAADGYARVKGIGALVTTSGVGELSAINGIAGAYAERSPVVHITGTPPLTVQAAGMCLHHTFGDGNYRHFAQMAAHVVVAQANLTSSDTAADEVDRVLTACKLHSRPVYLELPTDMVKAQVPGDRLQQAINPFETQPSDSGTIEATAMDILERLYKAHRPFLLLDGFVSRYDSRQEAQELARALKVPTCSTPFGKSVLSETMENYHGVYAGPTGDEKFHAWAQGCDFVLALGPLFADSNTFGFTTQPDPAITVAVHKDHVDLGAPDGIRSIREVPMKLLLKRLLHNLDRDRLPTFEHPGFEERGQAASNPLNDEALNQRGLWDFISRYLTPGDIVLAETGTSAIGSSTMRLPGRCTYIYSPIWLSIGFALPATAGAAAAHRDLVLAGKSGRGRTIVFEGDGSFQMTAQAVSDMIRARLNVVILVLNNNGYTIERWIHGMQAHYNDIMPWQYLQTADYFGASSGDPSYPVVAQRVSTWRELSRALRHPHVVQGEGLAILEVMLDQADAPLSLQHMAGAAAKRFCT